MADENTQAPESSSAPATIEVPTNAAAYTEWRKTGNVPQAESAPAQKKSSDTKPADTGDEEGSEASRDAAESEPADRTEHKPSKAERRLNELLEDLRNAGLSPKELKTFRREAQAQLQQEKPKAAPEHTAKPADQEAPKKPRAEDFKTWEEYEAARDDYFEKMADFKAAKAVEADRVRQRQEAAEKDINEKMQSAKDRYKDDKADQRIISAAKEIFTNGSPVPAVIRQVMNESPVLVDVLYTLGKDAAALDDFLELCQKAPSQAMRKAILVEKLVMEELDGAEGTAEEAGGESDETPERDETGKFVSSKKGTKAPPPPKEVSGRSSAPADPVQSAFEAGDFTSFRAAANREEVMRRKGQI